jgi:hypothetical protein
MKKPLPKYMSAHTRRTESTAELITKLETERVTRRIQSNNATYFREHYTICESSPSDSDTANLTDEKIIILTHPKLGFKQK